MAGIFGDGQRGGIFGAKVDPRLRAELERRALEKRQMAQGLEAAAPAASTIGSRAAEWWNNSTLARMADPRTSPLGPAAIARLFMEPAGEVGRQVETGEQLAKPFTQFNDPQVDPVKQGADLALATMGGSSVVPAEVNSLRMGIKAYHGSPHDFERFDASKIGTGEGAQAYGHGLYVAENEAVAKQYRDLLGTRSSAVGDPVARAQFWASDLGSREAAVTHLEGVLKQAESRPKNFDADDLEKTRQAIDYLKSGGDLMPKSGHMYEVDIAADPEHFLDWDKPLSEQPPRVKGALEAQGMRVPDGITQLPSGRWAPTSGGAVVGRPDGWPTKGDAQTASQMIVEGLPRTGEQIYRQAAKDTYAIRGAKDQRWEPTGKTFEESLAMVGGDHSRVLRMRSGGGKDSAEALREAGIRGIKYLDQGSRPPTYGPYVQDLISQFGSKEKALEIAKQRLANAPDVRTQIQAQEAIDALSISETRNFVVFPGNEHLISILKKYGLPISAAGLAALSQLHPQEAQAAQKGKK